MTLKHDLTLCMLPGVLTCRSVELIWPAELEKLSFFYEPDVVVKIERPSNDGDAFSSDPGL